MEKQYLSLEEQFKKSLNNTEITQIDEHRISDQELCRLTDIDYEKERKELQEYCERKEISTDIIWQC